MNKNIDLTKILKDCPKGWKFYSSVYGEVEFVGILSIPSIQRILQKDSLFLSENDLRNYPIQFKAYDTIYRVTSGGNHIKGMGECTFFPSKDQRDWSKFMAPWYKKEKFDPKTLKPFDRVLAASMVDGRWVCDFFSHIGKSIRDSDRLYVGTGFGAYDRMIPYNDDTKHLVGTTEEAPEYYRYWED